LLFDDKMKLEDEHRKIKEFWDRKMSQRSKSPPQFRYQEYFYLKYRDQIKEPILDLGCGDGEFLDMVCKDGKLDIYGLDISEVAVQLARKRLYPYLGNSVDERIKMGDMIFTSNYFKKDFFGTVVCEGTIHQSTCTGARMTANEIHKVLVRGGLAYISTRSRSTIPDHATQVEGERETYRMVGEGGVVRCYFSREGVIRLVEDLFEIIELEEKEVILRVEGTPYKMWILVLKKP